MRHVSAYMLLKMGGNESPSKKDVEDLLSQVGVKVDGPACDEFFKALEGKEFDALMKAGTEALETACAGAGGGGGDGAAAEAKEEESEEEEESAGGGGNALFG